MRLPGFTAESSLSRTANRYLMAGGVSGNEGGLYPAQDLEMLNPIDFFAGGIPEISGDMTGDIPSHCERICGWKEECTPWRDGIRWCWHVFRCYTHCPCSIDFCPPRGNKPCCPGYLCNRLSGLCIQR